MMIRSGEVELYVESTGTGYPIVFVHELASDLREWELQVQFFSREYRCITYNARGYPPSDVPNDPKSYGWELALTDLVAVLDGLDIRRAHVVGLSMGAYTALQLAVHHPDRASAVVAAAGGTGSDRDSAEWHSIAERVSEGFRTRSMDEMALEFGNSASRLQLQHKNPRGWEQFVAHLREHSPVGMANTMSEFQGRRPSLFDFKDPFASISTPVLLAVGDEDEMCLGVNVALKHMITGADLWVLPGSGHAINLEEPTAFNEMVAAFLNAVDRRLRS